MADQQRRVSLIFDANTSGAQSKVDALAKSINRVMEMSSHSTGVASLDKDLQKSAQAAAQLRVQLTNAFNTKTGSLDLTKFNESLKSSGMSLDKYQQTFSKLGPAGEQAFNNLARSIATAEVPLRRSNTLLNDFALTLKNTIKWQLSSSIMHGFLTSVQSAMSYAQHLNQNLTDIRIVTGQSADEMARFAEQANKSARELSTTTNQYAQAALIFYQQGLSDKAVKERTDTVIKMANVTGEAAKDVSSYMTAIWNNFDDGSKSLEYYADVITKLGAATAASSKEIAGGLEKFAAVGETIGLSYEYATAMLTTIIDKTRQSEDIVGTALKTILARIQGLNLGETLDDGTTLNKYSAALASVGVQIKDASGQLRDMDAILNDLGGKWQTLSKDTQVALAQVVGGVRQYNQIISLMDNWDAFEMNVDIALGSEGELQEQADIYANSWKAAQKEVQAALESIYSKLIDENFFIGFQQALAKILTTIGNLIDGLGGVGGVLATLGSIVFRVFNTQISNSIDNSIKSIKMLTKAGRQEVESLKREAQNKIIESASKNKNDTVKNAYTSEAQMQLKVLANAERMNAEEQQLVQTLMQQHQARVDAAIDAGNELQKAEQRVKYEEDLLAVRKQLAESALNAAGKDAIDVDNSINKINQLRSSVNDLTNFSDQALSVLSNTSMTTEEKLQVINNLMQQTSQTSGTWSESAKQAFGDLQSALQAPGATIESTKQSFISFMETLGRLEGELSKTESKFIEEINALKENTNLTDSQKMALDRLISSYVAVARATENSNTAKRNAKQATDDLKLSEENLGKVLDGLSKKPMSAGQQIMAFASTLMNITTLIKNVQGLFDVLGDKEMSFGEKLLTVVSTMASMGMTIAMLITNMEKLAATTVYVSIKSAALTVAKAFETGGWIAASTAIRAYISSLLAAIGPVGWIILAIAGITAAIVALTNALQNQESEVDKAQKNLKRIAEENKKLAKEVRESTKEIEDMYSTFDDYEDAYEALEKLTEGTDSWATALANVKTLTQQLIDAYPILADMIANPDKYGTTLSNIFDENGNIRPEILEEVEARTVKRTNLDLFGSAAQADENAIEAVSDNYTVYRAGVQKIDDEFNVGGSWGGMKRQENGDFTSTGLQGAVTEGTFRYLLPLMTEYYGSLSAKERRGMESNADFFNGANLMEALKMNDYYYNKDTGAYTKAGYETMAGFLNSGYNSYYDDYHYGDRKADLSGILDLYDLWDENSYISGEDLAIMDSEALERAMLQSDTFGLHESWTEGKRTAPGNRDILNSMDAVVGSQLMDYVSAVTDTQSEITGLGTGVLTQLGLKDERGNRRGPSSFSDVDSIAGMVVDQAVDEWVADVSNELPGPEKIAEAFSLTSTDSLNIDDDGNYVLTAIGEDGQNVTTTYTPDHMRRTYAYNQLTEGWAADESITDVGSWISAVTGINNVAAINALNHYDTKGVEGLTLEDLRALNSDEMAPYMARTFEDGEIAQKIGAMERAENEGLNGYNYGIINSLYGDAEEDIYAPLRSAIASINAERITGGQATLAEKEINAVTSAVQSGDMDKAIALLHKYGGESQVVEAELESLEATAYNAYSAMSRYSGLASNFDETAEAVRELNKESGEIDQNTYDMLVAAGLDMSNVEQIGSKKYSGSISWDSYLEDYYNTKDALALLDSGGQLSDEQKKLFGYTGQGTQSGLNWEDYIQSDEGLSAITASRGGIEAVPEKWIINELSRFGFEYYDKLIEEGATITDETLAAMATAQAEIDEIELPKEMTFSSKEGYLDFIENLKIDEAVNNFISNYANSVESGLMRSLAGDTKRLDSENAQLDTFRQQLADMLGMSVEDITDEFIIQNWDNIIKLGSNTETDVQAAMVALNPQIDATRKNYADSLVRGLGEDTKAIANQALVTAAEAFKSGDYSDLTTTQLGVSQSQFYRTIPGRYGGKVLNTKEIDLALEEAGILVDGELAEDSSYKTIHEARQAFVEEIATYYEDLAAAATENLKDNLEDSLEDVTARILNSAGGFAGTYKDEDVRNVRASVAGVQKFGGRDASKLLESILGQAGNKASALAAEFANIDWDSVSVEELETIIYDLGLKAEITEEELEGLVSALDNAIQFTNGLTEALNNYSSDTELADKLRVGEDISAEDYVRAEEIYGADKAQEMFSLNANGTYSLAEGYNGSVVASQVEASTIAGFNNAALQWGDANTYFGNNGTAIGSNESFLSAQSSDQGISATDTALGYIFENIETLFPKVEAEAADRAIGIYQDSKRESEDLTALLDAFKISDISELFTSEVQQGIGRQAEESEEAYRDAKERIPRENQRQAWEREGFSEEDIDIIDKYGDKIQEAAKESEYFADSLEYNAMAADEIASEIMRYNRGLETAISNTKDWSKSLKDNEKGSEEYIKTTEEMTEALEDIYDLDEGDLEGLDLDWDRLNKDMKTMAEGSGEEAAAAYQDGMDHILDAMVLKSNPEIDLDTTQFDTDIEGMTMSINEWQAHIYDALNGIEAGGIIPDALLSSLAAMLSACFSTVDEAQAALTNMGVDGIVTMADEPTQNITPTNDIQAEIVDYGSIQPPMLSPLGPGLTLGPPISVQGVNYSAVPDSAISEGSVTNVGFKIVPGEGKTSVTKKAGAATKATQGTRPTRSGSGGRGGGGGGGRRPRRGGGGGGGGGGGSRAPTADRKKDSEKERYRTIKNQLEDLTDSYDKVSKSADRAFGKARILLLKDQQKELKKLASAQQDYIDEINAYYKQDLSNLDKVSSFSGVKVELDTNGTITNYDAIQDAMWADYNSHINDAGEVTGMDEEAWKKYEEEWEDIMGLIEQYEETQDLRKEALQQLQDYINEIYDLQLEEVTYSVEVNIDSSEYALEILDYLLGKIEDDAWEAANAINYMGKQAEEFLEQSDIYTSGIRGILENHTRDITDADGKVLHRADLTQADVEGFMSGNVDSLEKIKNLGLSGAFTDEEVQTLMDYHSQLLETNQSLLDLRESVFDKVLTAFEAFNEELEKGITKMENLADFTQAYRDIVDLVGKDNLGISDELLRNVGQVQVEQGINILGANRERKETLEAMIKDAEAKRDEAATKGLLEDEKLWNEKIEVMKEQLDDATAAFMDSWNSALEAMQAQFELHMGGIIETLSDALAGPMGKSLDELQDAFDRTNDLAEMYLPDYEKIYELNKLNRDITNSIDETDNVKAKQELAELQAEINELEKDGVQVSQYQTEDLRRRYELKLAEIALDEAQNTKSEVQMTRDADGNWSYVYTANEEDVAAAEQSYEDRLFALQQANADYINQMQEMLIQAETDLVSKIEEITSNQALSMEEQQAMIDEVTAHYTEKFSGYADELELVLDNNAVLYENDWTLYSERTGYKISADEEYVDKFNETALRTLTGFTTIEGFHQNFLDASKEMLDASSEAYESWGENLNRILEEAGTDVQDFSEEFDTQVQNAIDDSERLSQDIKDTGSDIEQTFADITAAVSNWEDSYSKTIDTILEKNTALATSFNTVLASFKEFQVGTGVTDTGTDTEEGEGGEGNGDGNENGDSEAMGQITIQKGYQYWGYKSPKGGAKNRVKVVNDDRKQRTYKFTQMDTSNRYKRVYIPSEGLWVSSYDPNGPKRIKVEKFDTGGYTGAWGSEGKMAMLHEKELVLNKQDTTNLLNAVNMIRQIASVIDLNAYSSAGFGGGMLNASRVGSTGTLEQVVHVTAEFPNATNREEIYAAFGDIVNLASQYANR